VRFYQYGLNSVEVIDNGCGIAEEDHESIGMVERLVSFSFLTSVVSVEALYVKA
jgi:DNA mismatch repair protein PMS2